MSAASRAVIVASLLALFVSPFAPGGRAEAGPSPAAAQDEGQDRLRQTIRSRFTVLEVTGGIVLVPRVPRAGVGSLELRDGTVAINGTEVTGSELRARLGRDADAVIELSYLAPSERQRLLLGEPEAPGVERGEAPSVIPPVPEPSRKRLPDAREPFPDRSYQRHTEGRVRIGGDIRIEEDEQVDGPVVAVLGSVYINGRVSDAVVAVGGGVTLGPRAEIRGDVTSVGGGVSRDPNAAVSGQINSVQFQVPHISVRPIDWWPFSVPAVWDRQPWHGFRLMGTLLRIALFALLAVLVTLLLPGSVGRIRDTVRYEPWKCALAGLFAQLLFVPLLIIGIVVLVISIVGIPLLVLVPFAVLAFFLALLLGFAGAASAFGGAVADRSTRTLPAALSLLVVGLALVWGLTVIGRVVSLAGGPVTWVAAMFLVAGFLVEYAAWTMGLGGALLTRFGRNGRGWTPVTPPPIPAPPVAENQL
jgi:hypothetical protein